jgi:glycosyltransferase involved in cell wall biosynthesis
MKVWLVSHAYNSTVTHDKLHALARLPGMDLTLVAPREWRGAFGLARVPPGDRPYRVVNARVAINGRIGGYFFRDGLRAMRRARPDVVHAEAEPWSLAAVQCLLAARGAPVVLFTWENLAGPPRALQRALERFVLRRVAFVICGNRAALARMRRLGVPDSRLAILPQFGVDAGRFAAGDATRVDAPFVVTAPRPRPVVGYVGRLVPEKAVDVLVEAMDAALGARLLVVGDGVARADLERAAARRPGLDVHFAGAARDSEIPDWLAAMDVLVLPSRTMAWWAEQFGHVLIEAMAAGVPVIGSSSGAIPEVIGDAGLVFAEGDAGALRGCLARVLGSRELRACLVERGRRRVQAEFTHEVIARAQHEIYARLLDGGAVGIAPGQR